tara:strand:- start:1476 stop:1904 length:429 start_codon:yes stop_codon:yes gene_type:complete
MSDKNKTFRSHCDIDVLLNKETDTVSVTVDYKPEMFKRPTGLSRYRYSLTDVKEELERRGILINESDTIKVAPSSGVIDNTSRFPENHRLNAVFYMAATSSSSRTKKAGSPATPPNPSPSSTKKVPSSTKKATKTTAKTTNK